MTNAVGLIQGQFQKVEKKEKANKKIFSRTFNRFIEIYALVIGLIKRVNSIARATLSVPVKIIEIFTQLNAKVKNILKVVDMKFRVAGGALTLFVFPVHVYNATRNGIHLITDSFKKKVLAVCEQWARFVLNVINIVDDLISITSVLSALKLIRKIAWIEPLSLISGAFQTIGLVLCCADLYRIRKCKNKFEKIHLKDQSVIFPEIVNYISDEKNAHRIKLSLGIDPKKLHEILRKYTSKEKQKEMIQLLKQRINHKLFMGGITLIASTAALFAIAILIAVFAMTLLFPQLSLLVKPIQVMKVTADFLFWMTSILFFGGFVFKQVVDQKFEKLIGLEKT